MNFEISITGVCAYAPDEEFVHGPSKVCVLMPLAGFPIAQFVQSNFENLPLKRHVPVLLFPLGVLNPYAYANGTGVYYLNNLAVWFKFFRGGSELPPGQKKLSVNYGADLDRHYPDARTLEQLRKLYDGAGNLEKFKTNLAWVPDLTKIVPARASKLDDDVFDPTKMKITTRILFDHGAMASADASNYLWDMRTAFKGSELSMPMTHLVTVKIENVDKVEIHFKHLRGLTPPPTMTFTSDAKIEFHSACDLNALNWKVGGLDTLTERSGRIVDEDFRWHYELLHPDSRRELLSEIKERKFLWWDWPSPIPSFDLSQLETSRGSQPLSSLNNCIGLRIPHVSSAAFWGVFA